MTNEEQIKKWKKQLEEYDKKRIAELNEIRSTPSVPISSRNKDADNGNFFGSLLGGLLPGSSIADAAIKNIRKDQTLQQEAKKQGIDLNNLYTTQENLNMFGADVGRTVEATGAGISSALLNLGKGTLIGARNMGVLSSAVDKAITDLRTGTQNAQVEELKSKAKEKGIDTVTLDEYLEKIKNTKTSLENIEDFSENIGLNQAQKDAQQRIVELQNETENEFAKKAIGFMPNLSQQVVTMGASLINPVLGTTVATGQAMGSYYDDAKARGMTLEQANDYSQIMGIVEGATEMIGIDKLIKAGKGAKALAKGGLSSAKKELSKEVITSTFGNLLGGAMDNFMQEALTEPIQEGVADWIGGKGNWENIDQRMLEAGINGAISSLIMGGANIGVQSAVGTASKLRNGQTVTQQELNQDLVDTLAEIDKLSKEEKQEFIDKYVTPGIQTAQDVVKNEQNQVPIEPNRAVPMQTSENAQQQVQEQEQQIIPNQDENTLNQNVEPQNLVESAERSGIDVKDEKTRKNLEVIQKFNENRGIKATFDADAFKGHDNINSFFRVDENGNREIVFNPNTKTNKTIEQLAVHEVYHDMLAGGSAEDLTNFVIEKMSGQQEYQDYIRALQDVYEETNSDIIKEEAVAHYLEKNLGTNEFISELQQRGDRTTIQKIIDTIKDMITKAKNTLTGKGELNYLLDLKRKYEQAYNGEFKGGQEQTKLSKQVEEPSKVKFSKSTDAQGNETYNLDAKDLSAQDIVDGIKKSDGTLLAIHNLSEEKLKGILELGGFPVPSIAITNPSKVGHNQFGDISVVFDKSAIDPSNPLNEVYDRDVWSPTFPQVDYEINENALKDTANKLGIETWRLKDYAEDSSKPEYLVDSLSRNEEVIDKYIKDNNLNYETAYEEDDFKRSYNNTPEMQQFVTKNNITIDKLANDKNLREQYFKIAGIEKDKGELYDRLNVSFDYYKDTGIDNFLISTLKNDIQILNGERKTQPKIDTWQTNKNKEKVAEKNGLKNYLQEQVKNVYGDKGIYNGKDYITENGRRSFWQLHDEYNLENIVDALTSKDTKGTQDWFAGYGQIQAKMANQFDSIQDIKANENLITSLSEENNILTEARDNIEADIDKLVENNDIDIGVASELLADFASDDLTIDNFKRLTRDYYQITKNVSDTQIKKIIKDLKTLKNLPTDYFEAKPQRAVGFDEVATIVIPKGMTELSQTLQDKGLDVIEYDPNIEGDRQAKLDALSEYKFSKQGQGKSQQTIDKFLEKTKVNEGTGTKIKELARVPETNVETEPVRQVAPKQAPAQVPQVNEVKQRQVEPIRDITDVERPQVPQNQKTRKTYESIINSNQMTQEAKQIAKELMGYDTYVPQTNEFTLSVADRNIKQNGVDESLTSLTNKINNNDRVNAVDIATGERLIEYYSKIGDRQKLQEAIQSTAMAGTEAGRAVQAMSMINHQTPIGQVTWIQRSVDKVNKRLAKEGRKAQFNFTPEMQQKILNSTSENLQQNLNEVYQELGKQVPKSNMEKFNEWRYFSMLANPKTHIRNILGNTVMKAVQNMKNKVAGTIEDFVIGDNAERWNSLKGASKGMYEFAKNDLKNADVQSMLGLNENKYNPQSRLQQNQRTFKSDLLEKTLGKAFELNSKALEVEDGWGLKSGYAKAMTNYLNANNLDYNNLTDAQLQKARQYAVQQAKEATFHQDNTVANMLQTLENKNLFTKVALGGAIPFKKTPMNVALTGFEYSPAGFAKTLTTDLANLRKGKISANQFIDNISKNLTGTAITLVGYGLTQAGILKASGSGDEDKDEFEEATGKQNYSIQIGDKTYSLDWLTPAGIPLFIGSELYQVSHQKEDGNKTKNENEAFKSITKILDATASAMNPMSEMTMISGLTNALKSYAQGSTKSIENMLANVGKSYVTQTVPTALGQIARSTDQYERSTTSTETDPMAKAIDSAKNQIISKIPGLRETLPVSTDVWGNERETQDYVSNAILPWTSKEISKDPVNKALTDLYDATGESGVLPDNYIDKSLTIDKEKYKLTNEEYARLKQQYGKTAHDILSDLTKSKEYEQMSDEQKVKAVKEAYSYAKSTLKVTYSDENNLDAEESSTYKKVQSVIDNGGDAKEYFEYTGLIDGVKKEKEKRQILLNSNLKDKGAIYESTIGSDDETYQIMKATGIDPDAYLDYKQQDFSSDKEDDGTIKGKTVSGSGKTKFYDYMDNANMTYEQKLLLTGMKYKLLPGERDTLANYIDTLPISASDKTDIYKKLKGATVYQNGEIYY